MTVKTLFLLLLVGGLTVQAAAKEVLIAAKIQNPTERQMSFSYWVDALVDERKLAIANLNEQNEILFLLDFPADQRLLQATYNGYTFDIFILNESKIELTFEGTSVNKSLRFMGEGAARNNLLADFRRQFDPSGQSMLYPKGYLDCRFALRDVEAAALQNLDDYQAEQTRIFEQKMAYLKRESAADAVFKQYLKMEISYGVAVSRLAFFIVHQDKYPPETLSNFEKSYGFQSENTFDNALLPYETYQNFWKTYIYFQYLKKATKDPKEGFAFYTIAETQLKTETRDFILAKILINAKKENNLSIAEQRFQAFRDLASSRSYPDKVEQFYDGLLEFEEAGAAPNFSFVDTEGNLRSLSEFKGKVVYISFWATWCKPCLVNFRKTEFIRNQLSDLGVILLNISLDESDGMWRSTMARTPMPGINLRAGNNETLKMHYDLSKLPTYHIVDKKGNFAYLPEDGPRDILAEFAKLTKE